MNIIKYASSYWIKDTQTYDFPRLVTKAAKYYEVKDYFKRIYNIDVIWCSFESTDNRGVIFSIFTKDTLSIESLGLLNDAYEVSSEMNYDYGSSPSAYLKISFDIEQTSEIL